MAPAAATACSMPPLHSYQVLGVPKGADTNAVQRAYKLRMSEVRGRDEAAQQQIEAAHSAIMMAALSSRLKVGKADTWLRSVLKLSHCVKRHTRSCNLSRPRLPAGQCVG